MIIYKWELTASKLKEVRDLSRGMKQKEEDQTKFASGLVRGIIF